MNQHSLAKAWETAQRSTEKDWQQWLWGLNIQLLRESPIPSLRACHSIAQAHAAIATELFQPAFLACWLEMSENYKGEFAL